MCGQVCRSATQAICLRQLPVKMSTTRCQRRAIVAANSGGWIDGVRGKYVASAYLRSRPERLLLQLRHSNAPSPPEAGPNGTLVASIAWYGLWELKLALCGGVLRSAAAEVELGQGGDVDFQVESRCKEDFGGTGSFLAKRLATYAMTLAIVVDVAVESKGPVITLTIYAFLGLTLEVQFVDANHFRRRDGHAPDFTCNLLLAVPLIIEPALHGLANGGAPRTSIIGLHTKTTHLKCCQCVELRLLPGAPAHYTVARVIYECRQLVFGCLKDPALGTMPDRMDRLLARISRHPRSLALVRWRFVPGLGRQPTYVGQRKLATNVLLAGPTNYFF